MPHRGPPLRLAHLWSKYGLVTSLACAAALWLWGTLRSHHLLVQTTRGEHRARLTRERRMVLPKRHYNTVDTVLHRPDEQPSLADARDWSLPLAFDAVLQRARTMQQRCRNLSSSSSLVPPLVLHDMDVSAEAMVRNETFPSLPSLGILQTLEGWKAASQHPEVQAMRLTDDDEQDAPQNWQCQLPPAHECQETKLTVVFMAYNPDRLQNLLRQVKKFLQDDDWQSLVAEVVLVWNGSRPVEESKVGQELLSLAAQGLPFRVVYPLRQGLQNDLLNRYHPSVVRIEHTKAILFYDDDGPFYPFAAVRGGFELWKRHPRAQMAAMSRHFVDSPRQRAEGERLLQAAPPQVPRDQVFVSHCTNADDHVEYDYHYFANYDAHMALPSGSILHVNYLCFVWHPVLEPIRAFVRAHPVHPDDVTVSMIVSQLAGQAPRVYSRRLNPPSEKDRALYQQKVSAMQQRLRPPSQSQRLLLEEEDDGDAGATNPEHHGDNGATGIAGMPEFQRFQQGFHRGHHRSLMELQGHTFNWDAYSKGDPRLEDLKMFWAELRTQAINALVRYFGSFPAVGSIGWCEGTPFYNDKVVGRCDPPMAKQGWLPWMDLENGSPKPTCP